MKKYFGGSHLIGKRKSKRPLSHGHITHFILRLKENLPSFFSPKDEKLRSLFCEIAKKHEIQIQQLVFNHTHLHAGLLIKERKSYNAFVREFTSKMVVYLSKSIGVKLKDIFLHRPFTRIVKGLRGLMRLENYMKKNERESKVRQIHRYSGFFRIVTETARKRSSNHPDGEGRRSLPNRRYGAKPLGAWPVYQQLEFF